MTTYFVKNGGNDTFNGLSDSSAWATNTKVNTITFDPGDFIKYAKGSTFETYQRIDESGSDGLPITWTNYVSADSAGATALPIITLRSDLPNFDSASSWIEDPADSDRWRYDTTTLGQNFGPPFIDGELALFAENSSGLSTKYNIAFTTVPDSLLWVYSEADQGDGNPANEITTFTIGSDDANQANSCKIIDGSDYIVIDGIDFQSGNVALRFTGTSDHIIIRNNKIGHLSTGGISFNSGDDILIDNNIVSTGLAATYTHSLAIRTADGLSVKAASNLLITDNTVENWGHVGIVLSGTSNGDISGAVITGNDVSADDIDYGRGFALEGAELGACTLTTLSRNEFHGLPTRSQVSSNANSIIYNIFRDTPNTDCGNSWSDSDAAKGQGLMLSAYVGPTIGNLIYNNTFDNHPEAAILLEGTNAGNITDNLIRNNIGDNCGNDPFSSGSGSGPYGLVVVNDNSINTNTFENNDWFTDGVSPIVDYRNVEMTVATFNAAAAQSDTIANNIQADPLFVSATDRHLTVPSPCVDAGQDVGLTTDFDGSPVVPPPDIGAYELTDVVVDTQDLQLITAGWAVNTNVNNAVSGVVFQSAPGTGRHLTLKELNISMGEGSSVKAIVDSRSSATATATRIIGPVSFTDQTRHIKLDFTHTIRVADNQGLYITSSGASTVNIYASGEVG